MAKPLTLTQIKAAFDYWGVPYEVVPGAETRGNKSGWGDPRITGVMGHHTASDGSDAANRNLITNGRSDLSGPLANFGGRDDGVIDIIACGAANHAGGGDPDTLKMVQQEKTPLDREVKPDQNSDSPGAVNGNPRFYGWEMYYGIGSDLTMNPKQYRVMLLSMAAIIWALDNQDGPAYAWTGRAMIGHREWTNRKPDPRSVDLAAARRGITLLLTVGPARAKVWFATGVMPDKAPTTPTVPSKPPATSTEVARYTGTSGDVAAYKTILDSDAIANPNPKAETNRFWSLRTWLRYVGEWAREAVLAIWRVEAELVSVRAELKQIKAAVGITEDGSTNTPGGTQ